LAVATEVWSLLVPMSSDIWCSFCNAYQNAAPLSAAKVMKGDMELYSKLSHDITQVIEEKHLL
jgi:hypothetical protein